MATTTEKGTYIEAVGRRKTAVARVRLYEAKGDITINDRELTEYFPTTEMQEVVRAAFKEAGLAGEFSATIKVFGGGNASQAEAVRHGVARALVKYDPDLRKTLKKVGFLKRDPRVKERKKFGLRKARRAPQWSKR